MEYENSLRRNLPRTLPLLLFIISVSFDYATLAGTSPVAVVESPALHGIVSVTDGMASTNGADANSVIEATQDSENKAPAFLGTGDYVLEVRKGATGAIGKPVTAIDPDDDVVTYSLAGADSALFTINKATGQLWVRKFMTLDFEDQTDYTFEVVAQDPNDFKAIRKVVITRKVSESGLAIGALAGALASMALTTNLRKDISKIQAGDKNRPPEFPVGILTLNVPEIFAGDFGNPVTATDPDGDQVTYRLTGANRNYFAINPNTGQLSVGTIYTLNFELQTKYFFEVIAIDSDGLTSWREVVVTVTDVVEDDPCVEKNWRALVALYKATGGANWTNKDNWSPSLDRVPPSAVELNKWHGVRIPLNVAISDRCVTELRLSNNNLVGELPKELKGLTKLQVLQLWENNLSGQIPKELGELSDLTEINMYSNQLNGPIPRELGSLKKLEKLRLNTNKLSDAMPSELTKLKELLLLVWYDQDVSNDETALCAPTYESFKTWLGHISTISGKNCVTVRARRTKRSVSAPRIEDVSIISDPGRDGIYTATERIEVAIQFDLPVIVDDSPHLILSVGNKDVSARPATVGTVGALQIFRYIVVKGDHDADGVSISANALKLNNGSIVGEGVDAVLDLDDFVIKDDEEHIVDARDSAAEKAIVEDIFAAQGRAILASVTGVIGERFRARLESLADGMQKNNLIPIHPRPLPPPNSSLATRDGPPPCGNGVSGKVCAVQQSFTSIGGLDQGIGDVPQGSIGTDNFVIPMGDMHNESTSPGWTIWGTNDVQKFGGSSSRGNYDGDLKSFYLGFDGQIGGDWLAGLALSKSHGETAYKFANTGIGSDGNLQFNLTSMYFYSHGWLPNGLELWGIAGLGGGEVVLVRQDFGSREIGDLGMGLGAIGMHQELMKFDTMKLSFLADVSMAQLQSESRSPNRTIDNLSALVTRVRVGIEGEHFLTLNGGSLRPFWQVSGRYDGGDGLTGTGLELVGGVLYDLGRLDAQVQARWLAVHSSASMDEFGVSATLRIKPDKDGLGFSASLSPQWGASSAGTKSIWGTEIWHRSHDKATQGVDESDLYIDGRMGYGFALPRSAGVVRPFGELRVAGESMVYQRIGIRLDQSVDYGSMNAELGVARVAQTYRKSMSVYDFTINARF